MSHPAPSPLADFCLEHEWRAAVDALHLALAESLKGTAVLLETPARTQERTAALVRDVLLEVGALRSRDPQLQAELTARLAAARDAAFPFALALLQLAETHEAAARELARSVAEGQRRLELSPAADRQ